jgi:hypothetical protein
MRPFVFVDFHPHVSLS